MDDAPRRLLPLGTCTFIWRTTFTTGLGAVLAVTWWAAGVLGQLAFQLHDLPRDIAAINQTLVANHDEVADVKREITATERRVVALEAIFRASRMAPPVSDHRYIPLPPGAELTEPWNKDRR